MNQPPVFRSLSLKLSLVIAALGIAVAACASTEVIGWEEPPDAAPPPVQVPEGGVPASPVCGNGVLEFGEECDDGNTSGGDGCSATCKKEDEAPPPPCQALPITLNAVGDTRVATVTGDTSGAQRTMESDTCGGGNGNDLVYALTSDVPGRAVVRLSAGWSALLYVRKNCVVPATELSCESLPAEGGQAEIALPLAAGETVYVIVDGAAGQSGSFTLDVSVSEAFCGDGIATYPEQCDDGNTTNGDGCSATCQLESGDSGAGTCPGLGLTFVGDPNAPRTIELAGDVSLLANTSSAWGCSGTSSGGKDQAYAITPTIDGALTAVLHASYPEAAIHVRRECFSSGTEVDCAVAPTGPVRVSFPVSANQTYTVFVDSKSGANFVNGGLYRMELTLSPATCGNGILELPEECDDGNTTDGDGCSATCTLEPLPAGIDECPGATITFDGDPTNGPLTYRRTASTSTLNPLVGTCGSAATQHPHNDAVFQFVAPFSGWLTARANAAFNMRLNLRDSCVGQGESLGSLVCVDANGGTGEERIERLVEAGKTYYLVVDGPSINLVGANGPFTLDLLLEKAVCGNGRIEGGEACDDGNTTDGDTCSSECEIEPLGSPSRDTCLEAEELTLVHDPAADAYTARATGGNWNLTHVGAFAAPCGATVGHDAWFKVVAPIDGVIVVDVDATYNVTPGLRKLMTQADITNGCPKHTGQEFLTCSNRTSGPGGERFAFPVEKDTPYWIIVDAANATTDRGSFTLDVSIKAEDCGDGVVGGTEECDDGNLADGDGCSSTCKLEPFPAANTCPGHAVSLTGTGSEVRSAIVTLSTANLTASYAGACGGSSRDGVIAVTSDITGTMSAQLEAFWPSVLYAREDCTNSSTQLACNAFNPAQQHRTLRDISVPVIAGIPTYLFIDGLEGASGPGTLHITVAP